jgi:predicted nuclease of predicted toxin-antitoxin system
MKVFLDQGLPRSAAGLLRNAGTDALHTGECNLATSTDAEVLDYARRQSRIIFTLDADFHTLLVLHHAAEPSVVRIRIEGLRAEATVNLVQAILNRCPKELANGAMISVTENRIRIRHLPV